MSGEQDVGTSSFPYRIFGFYGHPFRSTAVAVFMRLHKCFFICVLAAWLVVGQVKQRVTAVSGSATSESHCNPQGAMFCIASERREGLGILCASKSCRCGPIIIHMPGLIYTQFKQTVYIGKTLQTI